MLKNFWHFVTDTPHDDVLYYRDLLIKGNSLIQAKQIPEAEKAYKKIIKDIPRVKSQTKEFLTVLSNAYLGMGYVYRMEHKYKEAVEVYFAALIGNFVLPIDVVRFLAGDFAGRKKLTPKSIDIYKTYITTLGERSDPKDPVINFLKDTLKVCLEPAATSEQVNKVITLAKELLLAKPNLEWALFFQGYSEGRIGNFQEAIKLLLHAEQLNPTRAPTSFYIGYFYTTLRDFPNAYRAFQRSLNKDPSQPETSYFLAKSILDANPKVFEIRSDLLEEAAENMRRATSQNPNRADYWYYTGIAEKYTGNQVKALDAFARTTALEPKNYVYQLTYGSFLNELGEIAKALNVYQAVYQIDPNKYEVNVGLASLYFQTGKYADAHTYYQRSSKIRPNHDPVTIGLGICLFQQNRWAESVDQLKIVKAHTKDSFFTLGRAYSLTHQYKAAASVLQQSMQQFGESGLEQYFLGLALGHIGQWEDAVKAFARAANGALSTNPSKIDVAVAYSSAMFELQQHDEVVKFFQSLPGGAQNDTRLIYLMATALIRQDQWTEAEKWICKSKTMLHTDAGLLYLHALILEHKKHWKDAAQAYLGYLSLAGQNLDIGQINTRRGACLCRAGDLNEALDVLLKFTSYCSETRYWVAATLTRLGRYQEALIWWNKLQLEIPNDKNIHDALVWTLFKLGLQLFNQKKYKEAILEWKQCIENAPENPDILHCLEESYFRLAMQILQNPPDNFEGELRSNLEAAKQLDPGDLRVVFFLGLEALLVQDSVRALSYLEQITPEQWGNALPIYYQAVACLQANRKEDAKKLLETLERHVNQMEHEYHLLAANISILEQDWEAVQTNLYASMADTKRFSQSNNDRGIENGKSGGDG